MHHAFLYIILAVVARLRHETSNFTRPLYGVDEHNKKFSSSFSKLRYDPFGFNPWKFRQHLTNYTKLNKIGEF